MDAFTRFVDSGVDQRHGARMALLFGGKLTEPLTPTSTLLEYLDSFISESTAVADKLVSHRYSAGAEG